MCRRPEIDTVNINDGGVQPVCACTTGNQCVVALLADYSNPNYVLCQAVQPCFSSNNYDKGDGIACGDGGMYATGAYYGPDGDPVPTGGNRAHWIAGQQVCACAVSTHCVEEAGAGPDPSATYLLCQP